MCDQDIQAKRARDLERYHRRTAENVLIRCDTSITCIAVSLGEAE